MKKIISTLAIALVCSAAVFAQNKEAKKAAKNDFREKMRSEQVAFITSELNLTESEAQAFWPVYNDIQAQKREAFGKSFEAMKALKQAVDGGEDTKKLLDEYLKAKKAVDAIEYEAPAKYAKVLPADKVAKLVLSEERFRHQLIGRLGGGNRPGGPGEHRPHQGGSGKGQRN